MTLTKSEANRLNGKKGGRPKGRKNDATIEKEIARKAYEQWVLNKLDPLFQRQLLAALGVVFIYRKEHHGTGASKRIEHVQLTEDYEIADALDRIANNENGFSADDGFCYIMAKAPDTRAIDSMLNRSIGPAAQKIEHSGPDGGPIPVQGVEVAVRKV